MCLYLEYIILPKFFYCLCVCLDLSLYLLLSFLSPAGSWWSSFSTIYNIMGMGSFFYGVNFLAYMHICICADEGFQKEVCDFIKTPFVAFKFAFWKIIFQAEEQLFIMFGIFFLVGLPVRIQPLPSSLHWQRLNMRRSSRKKRPNIMKSRL